MSRGKLEAQRLLYEIGVTDPAAIEISKIAFGLGATVIEKPLTNSDGRIVFSNKKTIITINSRIEFVGKKRFTTAHEIGHYRMHRDHFQTHNDTDATLQYFKKGHQETEANEFASELLMPEGLFKQEIQGKKFDPQLLRDLADRFQTSITSVAYKYFELGDHPICLFYSYDNKVSYWKRPENYPHYIIDRTKLPPPEDSVAAEFFDKEKIYRKADSKQPIWKSTWFELNNCENDQDFKFYEYCIITSKYNTVLSIVWEEI